MTAKSKFDGFPQLITERDWIRMAAFMDGEGCIRIGCSDQRKYNPKAVSVRHDLQLVIANTDPRLMQWCQEKFGGYVYYIEQSKRSNKHRDSYNWRATSHRAESVLRGCLPHFLLKREQAEIAIAFCSIAWDLSTQKVVPEEVIAERSRLKQQLEQEKVRKFEVIDGFRKKAKGA